MNCFGFVATICVLFGFVHPKTVSISTGTLRGKSINTYGLQHGYAFLGIPFTEKPVGPLRFKKPIPPKPWNKTLDATIYEKACAASDQEGPISEDCLYLNVFTSDYCLEKGDCAVLVVVHGGAYWFESPVAFDPEVITNNFANEERKIVVVTLPYRLGIFGWFHLPEGNWSDSNLAMRDLIAGFEWVKNEISCFGGDSSKMTGIGHSSGATMLHILSLSPLTDGLFNQMILMSSLNKVGDASTVANQAATYRIAQLVGCHDFYSSNSSDIKNITECMRSKDWKELLVAQEQLNYLPEDIYGTWLDGEGGVLPEPERILMRNRRPTNVMIGTVTGELRDTRIAEDKYGNAIPSKLKELCSHLAYEMNYEHPEAFQAACESFYDRTNKTQMFSDDLGYYVYSSDIANSLSKNVDNKVFVYSFSYENVGNASSLYLTKERPEPRHAEDYIYIFGLNRNVFSDVDYEIEKIYTGMMANFVNTGDPTYNGQTWTKWTSERRNYFNIDFDAELKMPGMKDGYYYETDLFWNSIANRVGGSRRLLTDFPPHIDTYKYDTVQEGLSAKWTNFSHSFYKKYKGVIQVYDLWTEFVIKRREEHKKKQVIRAKERRFGFI